MCGVAGVAYSDGLANAEPSVRAMLPALARRGPDAEGIATWAGVCLGHRRLAILDLSPTGAQPMLNDDASVGVVFNGCIYNFLEIRHELEQLGHRFRSRCDTEILVEGYREWGIDKLVPKLRGMFAFGIWDHALRKLTLVRDRLGVKPLVYHASSEGIAFASTLAALEAGGFTGDIDSDAVLEFLDVGYVTEERSIFLGTRKLPPASILEWQDGKTSERRYWDLPEADESSSIRFEEAVEETERLILEAVRLRLVSDVPIGALLSGGIDSSLICWGLSKANANIRAFTVGIPGEPDDEGADAQAIARKLGIAHQIVSFGANDAADLEELVAAYSEPFGSQSALGMLNVSRAVKSEATVLLTGDGGDDIFLGYPHLHNAWKAEKLANRLPPGALPLWNGVRAIVKRIPSLQRAGNFLDYATGGIGPYARVRVGVTYFSRRNMIGEALHSGTVRHREMPASSESARNLLADVFQFHRRMHFTSEFMAKVDGGTMYHSLEARSPLLDQALWEFAAKLPARIRFHNNQLKAVLREIVRRHLGPEVADRRKQGFTIPVERWLASQSSGALKELKADTLLVQQGWFYGPSLASAVDEALSKQDVPQQLWYALVLERWLRKQSTLPTANRQPAPVAL